MEIQPPEDACQRAWAAGVFDGEGSATLHLPKTRKRPQAQLSVYQAGRLMAPPVLTKFQAIVDCGSVLGPYRQRLWCWRTGDGRAIGQVATSLWPWLGAAKRKQFLEIADRVPTLWFIRAVGELWDETLVDQDSRPQPTDVAWAAGLFVGEGHLGISNVGQPRAELTQASAGEIPDVLRRFKRAVMNIGQIDGPYGPSNSWSRLPQYRWRIGSFEGVQAVIAVLWPWLDDKKRQQARLVLSAVHERRVRRQSPSGRSTLAPRVCKGSEGFESLPPPQRASKREQTPRRSR